MVSLCSACLCPSVFHAKAAGLLQLKKLHDRSSIQLGLSPVLAQLKKSSLLTAPSASAASGEAAASTSARLSAEEAARTGRARHAGVLRNITNAPSSNAAGAAASHLASKPSQRPTLPASTLAQLAARNESNRPLASHETLRFGMAATQAREAAAKALENQRGYEATQAAAAATQQQSMPSATSRKRKSGTINK